MASRSGEVSRCASDLFSDTLYRGSLSAGHFGRELGHVAGSKVRQDKRSDMISAFANPLMLNALA